MKRKRMSKVMKRLISTLTCAVMLVTMVPSVSAGNLHPDGDAKSVAIESAGEGITLLKNDDNVLPLSKEPNYPVFGQGSITHVPGGGGSGDMNIANASVHESVLEGMQQAGLKYDDTTLRIYREDGNPDWFNGGSSTAKAPEVLLTAEQVAASKTSSGSDTAIYVLRRGSAEGRERNGISDVEAVDGGSSVMSTRAASNYYLTTVEKNNFDLICEKFDNVVVVLNVTGVTDLSWIENYPQIKGVLNTYLPGSYGMISLGKILAGEVNPSGKLVDTWAKSLDDYPARAVSTSTFGTDRGNIQNPVYGEDIYVGYRYFETFAPDRVLYEFGFGMSYTTFSIDTLESVVDEDNVTVTVKVKNTGSVAGKEVVQVYYSAPQGVLGKPAKVLGAYAKTKELNPGESQTLEISYKTNNMASYDDAGITGKKSCYVLEAGDYDIYVGNSVKNVTKEETYNVAELTVTEQLSQVMTPVANEQGTPFNRLTPVENVDGTFTGVTTQQVPYYASYAEKDAVVQERRDTDLPWVEITGEDKGIQFVDVVNAGKDPDTGEYNWDEFMSQIPIVDLIQIIGNNTNMGNNKTLDDLSADQRERLLAAYPDPTATQITVAYYHEVTTVGSAGWFGTRGNGTGTTGAGTTNLEKYGIPSVACIDGPAGMRTRQNPGEDGNTWFQCGTLRAAMWNPELQEKMGYEIGLEGVYNDCDIWLAPGMNIHRDPLCGRNFEYYTEDPLVAGQTAAAETKGVQSAGQGVTLKHFAANQQEYSRQGGNSQVSERALREVYLKGFEIATKTASPWNIMTSYNRINGSYAASNFDLCTTILRKEWGWKGMVMTDWGGGKDFGENYGNTSGNAAMIRAQQDISMVYGGTGGIASGNANSGTPAAGTYKNTVFYRSDNADGDLSYYTRQGNKYVCTVDEANNDITGILRPILNDQLTMGEFQRSIVNIFDCMAKNVYYRAKRWDIGLAEYTYSTTSDFTAVKDVTPAVADPLDTLFLEYMIDYANDQIDSGALVGVMQVVVDKYLAALDNAETVLAGAQEDPPTVTQSQIDDAVIELLEAGHLLEFKVDKSKLQKLVDTVSKYATTPEKYTPATFAAFEVALTNANAVLADPSAMEDDVDDAWAVLADATAKLRLIPNKAELSSLLIRARSMDLSLFTSDSADNLVAIMDEADDALANENSTQDDVDGIYDDLSDGISNLVEKTGVTNDPADGDETSDGTANTATDKASNPKTGDAGLSIFVLILLAGSAVTIALKKRKENR